MTKPATKPVAEIVTFRLIEGADIPAFTQAARAMEPFLTAMGSMQTRVLSADDDGLWTDHIVWTSMEAAKTAAAQVMTEPSAQPFMAMIDPASVTMRHAPIALTQS